MAKTYIISVGGSLVVTKQGIDWLFLKQFRNLILQHIKQSSRFFLIVGGGMTSRNYVAAANRVVKVTADDLDWLGIHATRLNAHLLRTIFRRQAHPEIITNPTKRMKAREKIVVASGWRPGWSTDYVATILAEKYGIKTIINLSNISYVYDKDPKKFSNAKPLRRMNWAAFRKIVGNKWDPGLNTPFDPIASKRCQRLNLEVVIMNGRKINNLRGYLAGKKFRGTVIKGL